MADTNRVARLDEKLDEDDRGPIATGLFWGAIEAPDVPWPNGDAIESPIPLADALAWARARADRVSVIVNGEIFSAGRIPLDDPALDETLQYQRRRHVLWEFLDRTDDDPPIPWDVVVELDTFRGGDVASEGRLNPLVAQWRAEIEGSRDCQLLDFATPTGVIGKAGGGWTGYATTPIVLLRLDARTHAGASRAAVAVAEDAARSAGWDPLPEFSVGGAYATGSRPAGWNAHL
jgi:hypothetical protein